MQFLNIINLIDKEQSELPTILTRKEAKSNPNQSLCVANSCHQGLVPYLVTILFTISSAIHSSYTGNMCSVQ